MLDCILMTLMRCLSVGLMGHSWLLDTVAGLGRPICCANLYNCYDQQLYTNHDDASDVSSHVWDGTTTNINEP